MSLSIHILYDIKLKKIMQNIDRAIVDIIRISSSVLDPIPSDST